MSQTESEPDISLLFEDGTSQTSPLCKKIYTAELISSPDKNVNNMIIGVA
jgi:hypothetical protein